MSIAADGNIVLWNQIHNTLPLVLLLPEEIQPAKKRNLKEHPFDSWQSIKSNNNI
jgi:hypothetical protein